MGNSGILAVSNMESTFEKNVSPEEWEKLEKEKKEEATKVKAKEDEKKVKPQKKDYNKITN